MYYYAYTYYIVYNLININSMRITDSIYSVYHNHFSAGQLINTALVKVDNVPVKLSLIPVFLNLHYFNVELQPKTPSRLIYTEHK
jgi:hypothetical protein